MAGMVMSFATVDAQRPSGHRWYGGNDGSIEKLSQEIKGNSWSKDWRISREEAVSAYVFNLNQGFKMLGSTNEFGIPEFMHVLQNSTVQTLPPGTVFTNTLVDDAGKPIAFIDTVGKDGEKFFVYTDTKTGDKIAWAKASCMQSGLAVVKGNNPVLPAPVITPTQVVYAQTPTPEVNVTTGDVHVAPPIVTVVDSGDTYITNNYNQSSERVGEQPYYNQAPIQQCGGMGMGMGAGLYAQASFGWGMQQPMCNTWGNSMYYGPRGGGGYVIPSGGGGSNSSNQSTNVYVDIYNNIDNTNNNTSTNTNNNNVEAPFWQMPHYYPGGYPTGGNPTEPGNGEDDGNPVDSPNKLVRGSIAKGGGRQTNPFTTPATGTGPRSTQASSATSANDVAARRGVSSNTTNARNTTPAPSSGNNNTLRQRGVGPRNAQSTQTASPRTVAVSRNANQQSPAAIARNGNANSQQRAQSQATPRNNGQFNGQQQRATQNRSFAQPRQQQMQSRQMSQSRPASNMGGNRMSAPRPSGASVGMRR